MSNITFLEERQITGNDQLEIFRKYGTKCAITDFSILLGGYVASGYYTSEGIIMNGRTGWYWTRTDDGDNDARVVDSLGNSYYYRVSDRFGGCRPALPYSSIKSISSNGVIGSSGVLEVKYGEYPQTIIAEPLAGTLEKIYKSKSLTKTGKKYTTDSQKYDEYSSKFKPRTFEEYQYNGQKYVRFVGDYNCKGEKLSDGREIQEGQYYWVKVEPIVWQVDEKANIAVTKKLIFAGVQFNNIRDYKGDFDKTDIKKFIDNYFAKEIVENMNQTYSEVETDTKEIIEEKPKTQRKQNPYKFIFEDMSEEEIIRGAIESNIAVFLHGRSSEGKSARVKQIDPDCEIIYLRNATPDSLNGKSVYNAEKGEMIDVPPSWYKKMKAKCETEPDKLHILFFDEITNALPSIQGMAFNIILDKEVNGTWKLPDNCRIVAAGNDLKDSLAANQMAEPLFNRFAHVYIETTVVNWLRWASKPENHIHPSIYAYIAYKSYAGDDVLRTDYNGEKPNADPRKWEMASKALWAVGNPSMLRSLIGEELTNDFIGFCKQQVITVEDVVKGNYNSSDLEMNLDEKFATAIGLSSCEEKDIKVVREFVGKLGAEIQATFDVLWTQGEEDRIEQIAKLKMESSSRRN